MSKRPSDWLCHKYKKKLFELYLWVGVCFEGYEPIFGYPRPSPSKKNAPGLFGPTMHLFRDMVSASGVRPQRGSRPPQGTTPQLEVGSCAKRLRYRFGCPMVGVIKNAFTWFQLSRIPEIWGCQLSKSPF